jgi:hypothetical protein
MMSEWLKVMLEEIARKKQEERQAQAEERLRGADDSRGDGGPRGAGPPPVRPPDVPPRG